MNNNAPFTSCLSKTSSTLISNAEDLDIAMLMYNLVEYSANYSVTSRTFCEYYRDKMNDDENENTNYDFSIDNRKTLTNKHLSIRQK